MTRLTPAHDFTPSRSHPQLCVASRSMWMLAALVGRSKELSSQRDRPVEIYGSDPKKFNLDNTKSGWHLRLMPM